MSHPDSDDVRSLLITAREEVEAELEAWQAWAHLELDADAPMTDGELRAAIVLDWNAEHERAEAAESQLTALRQALIWVESYYGHVMVPEGCPCDPETHVKCPLHATSPTRTGEAP